MASSSALNTNSAVPAEITSFDILTDMISRTTERLSPTMIGDPARDFVHKSSKRVLINRAIDDVLTDLCAKLRLALTLLMA